MENVSINSSEIFFVQFTYHLNMNEQKRQIKTTKIIFPPCLYLMQCDLCLESWCSLTRETLKHMGLRKFKTWNVKNEQKCASGLKSAHTPRRSAELFLILLKISKKLDCFWSINMFYSKHPPLWIFLHNYVFSAQA